MEAALVVARFVHLATLLGVAGALAFPLYALPAGELRAWWADAPRLRRGIVAATAVSLVAAAAWFAATLGTMADDPAAAIKPQMLAAAFTETSFAPVWAGRLCVLALALALAWRSRPVGAAAASALALASVALTGHARAETGGAGVLHVASDALHLLAAGLWLGALPCLILLLRRRDGATAAAAVRRFSRVAVPAVAALVLTGALQTLLLAGPPWTLWRTEWGRWLLLKLALVAAMLALAADNRRRITPRLGRSAADGALRRSAAVELALGVTVVAVVALLGTLSPSG